MYYILLLLYASCKSATYCTRTAHLAHERYTPYSYITFSVHTLTALVQHTSYMNVIHRTPYTTYRTIALYIELVQYTSYTNVLHRNIQSSNILLQIYINGILNARYPYISYLYTCTLVIRVYFSTAKLLL